MEATADWVWVYKFGREVLMLAALAGITAYLYCGKDKQRLEEPARRMFEEDEA